MNYDTVIDILGLVGLGMLAAGIYMRYGVDAMLIVVGIVMCAVAVIAAGRGVSVPNKTSGKAGLTGESNNVAR
jgi:hypothetical protein